MDELETVRAFNRFYTRRVGALTPHFLGSGMALPEARLLFEIAQTERALAADLGASLGMDAGYLSRVLARFEARGWIERGRAEGDARRRPIRLTDAGRVVFADLDRRQRDAVADMLAGLAPSVRDGAIEALALAQALLDDRALTAFMIRTFRTGDMGLIAARQAILYAKGWGWGRPMEILLGEVTAGFLRDFKPGREQCWVGEIGGRMAGSIFLCDGGGGVAKLRLLYVEDFARGLGLGEALVDRCVEMAREAGYATLELWTHTILASARRIYAAKGFELIGRETHTMFGPPVEGETWRLGLRGDARP